ncbi:MAG: hypothetical protein OQK76_03815 [Gammaproteobacteria bacterium]|nr:hypothetical protein [Gammaproteobacteria bacterium]MCW8909732.1 hypothetical protein [Gammaproteobacteria bacterium]MCW9004935.1 hypothetical protein [Gammaproteobacteria bacterium]MCW9056331.1 hypothetical protein [Gammaproteobacteria bacterium]
MTTKNILMIARHRKTEALRMAAGLTLLDDAVSVLVCGELDDSAEVEEQMEALEFSDVPVTCLSDPAEQAMANAISQSDVVYMI